MELIDYIIQLVALIVSLISVMGKVHLDYKKTNKNFTKLLKEQFRGTENELMLLRRDFNNLMVDKDFRKNLRNAINNEVSTFVKINKGTPQKYKDILMFWGSEIDDLASRWYNSEFRGAKNKKKMEIYLEQWINGRILLANHFINSIIKGVKVLTNRDKEGLLFSELLVKYRFYIMFTVLISALSRNNFLDDEAIINEFTEFINEFFTSFLTHVQTWNLLQDKVYEDIT